MRKSQLLSTLNKIVTVPQANYDSPWKEALEHYFEPFLAFFFPQAHLRTLGTNQNPEARLEWKISLIKQLYHKGYSRENIQELFRLIDWMMTLPAELEQLCDTEISSYERQNYMPYITTIERRGILRTQRENLIDVLSARFESVPSELSVAINNLDDMDVLKRLLRQAVTIPSLSEFEQLLSQV
jgi:hypothetical protein